MARYVLQRLLAMLLTLFIIVTVAFLVIRLMPTSIYDDPTISAEVLDMIQAKYHLDRPLIEQYGIFMKNVLFKGDWGISMKIQPNVPVFQVLGGKVPLTLFINVVSLLAFRRYCGDSKKHINRPRDLSFRHSVYFDPFLYLCHAAAILCRL